MTHANKAIRPLTGIRGIAALAVVLYHLPANIIASHIHYGSLTPLIDKGFLGVDLFFILSGFVLSLVHQRDFAQKLEQPDMLRFWWLRLARVYPLHLCILLAYALLIVVNLLLKPFHYPGLGITEFIGSVFLLQIWLPRHSEFNAPAWSISAEALAYFSFPWVAFLTARLNGRLLYNLLGLGALVTVFALYPWSTLHFVWVADPKPLIQGPDALMRIGLEFTMGSLLFNLFHHRLYPSATWSDGLGFGLLITLPLALLSGLPHWGAVVWFLGLIACLSNPGPGLNAVLGNRPMVVLGEISYAIYLCHMFWFVLLSPVFKRLPDNSALQWSCVAVLLGLIIASAYALYHWVETPARQWLRAHMPAFAGGGDQSAKPVPSLVRP